MGKSTVLLILLLSKFIVTASPINLIENQIVTIYESKEMDQSIELFEDYLGNTFIEKGIPIPKGVKIISIHMEDGDLYLNLSKEIKNYGGTLTEKWIVNNILSVGFLNQDVKRITVFIEGEKEYFPEGTIIDSYSKEEWIKERMNECGKN